jgi:hypothetical protein
MTCAPSCGPAPRPPKAWSWLAEKFRKCPVDDSMKDVLYGLALDFERKRQFNKAVQVFEHIGTMDKKFKDIAERSQKLRIAGETVILGGRSGMKGGAESTVLMQGSGVSDLAKPTLGRYEVMKELGKGAMGVSTSGRTRRSTAMWRSRPCALRTSSTPLT